MPHVMVFLNEMYPQDVADCIRNPDALQADGVIFQAKNSGYVPVGDWARVIRNIGPQHVVSLAEANENNMFIMAGQNEDFLLAKEACKRINVKLVATLVYYEYFKQADGVLFRNFTLTWGELEDLRYKFNNAFDNKIAVLTRQYVDLDPGSGRITRRRILIDEALQHRSCTGAAIEFNPTRDTKTLDVDLKGMNFAGFVQKCLNSGKPAYVILPPRSSKFSNRYELDISSTLRVFKSLLLSRFPNLGLSYWESPNLKIVLTAYERANNDVTYYGRTNSIQSALKEFRKLA